MSLQGVLLALLSKEPNTGYGLGRMLRTELSHVWSAQIQQVYSELQRMHADGLLAVETIELPKRQAKKVYAITAAGLTALDTWVLEEPQPQPTRDDLLARLYVLERVPNPVIRRLADRERRSEEEAARLRVRIAELDGQDRSGLGLRLTLEAALSLAEARASWCKEAISAASD